MKKNVLCVAGAALLACAAGGAGAAVSADEALEICNRGVMLDSTLKRG